MNHLAGIRFRHVMASTGAWQAGHRAALVPVTVGCALAVGSVVVSLVVGPWRADRAASDVLGR